MGQRQPRQVREAWTRRFGYREPFSRPLAILPESAHSHSEGRFRAIGRTETGRGVFIVFTLRRKSDEVLIRPISARFMHKKEIGAYEKENPDL